MSTCAVVPGAELYRDSVLPPLWALMLAHRLRPRYLLKDRHHHRHHLHLHLHRQQQRRGMDDERGRGIEQLKISIVDNQTTTTTAPPITIISKLRSSPHGCSVI